jgi:hypothetical protein
LVDRRQHSIGLDARSFREAECDTDDQLLVVEVRERPAVSKQTTYRVLTERFNLKNLNAVEGKEQYRVHISTRLTALGNFDDCVDINKSWNTIGENINISAEVSLGYCELKKNTCKSWLT